MVSEYDAPVTPEDPLAQPSRPELTRLAAEVAGLRHELASARGLAEAALAAAEAARADLEILRARLSAPPVLVGPALGRALADHLSAEPAAPEPEPPAPAVPVLAAQVLEAPALETPALDAPAAPAPAPVALASLAELVPDDLSSGTAAPDLSPRPDVTLAGLAASRDGGAPIDLDSVDGVANDDEQRRRARLAALEARLQRVDHDDAPRRARLLALAGSRSVPNPARGPFKYILVLLLSTAAVLVDMWPLAFIPPIALLCWQLWRLEQNERLASLARGFAVPVHGRVLRDSNEVLAWLGAFWPAPVRPQDLWTSHRHVAVACEPDEFPMLLDVQLEQVRAGDVDYRPRVDLYMATLWPARLPLLRPGSTEMSPAIAELYARLRRAGFTIRVESEAGLMLHGSDSVVERVRTDPTVLGGLHNIVRDAVALARQLGARPALAISRPA